MISKAAEAELCDNARTVMGDLGRLFSEAELNSFSVADFGLSRPRIEGLQVLTFLDTKRLGAKVLVMLPHQTVVEHWHPERSDDAGKEETLRCLGGTCRVYLPGDDTISVGSVPSGQERNYNCRHELILERGNQCTIAPNTPHWFQGGVEGAVLLSISTFVSDLEDGFTNPDVVRQTVYSDD